MTFRPHGHQQPPYYAANGMVYEGMSSIPTVSTPGQDFDFMTQQAPIQTSQPGPYAFVPRQPTAPPATQLDLSPVDHVQIEFTDLAAPYPEDMNYKPRKQDGSRQPSTSMHMRRRAQNRASQRAFRERKEKHTQDLQRRLTEVEQQYEQLKQDYDVVHKEKCQLEAANRRCSCGGSIVASPGSVGDYSQASDCGDPASDVCGGDESNQGREAVRVNFDDAVYEVVDWGVAGQ